MISERQGNPPENRDNAEMRAEVQRHTEYLIEIATKFDEQVTKDKMSDTETSHESETLKTQISMIQNRLIHCCEGKLRRDRANAIFHEVSLLMDNTETRQLLLSKVKKGIHDERE